MSKFLFDNMIHDADVPNPNRKNMINFLLGQPPDSDDEPLQHPDGIPRKAPLKLHTKHILIDKLSKIWSKLGFELGKPHETNPEILQGVNVSSIIGNRSDYTSEHDFTVLLHALFSLNTSCAASNSFAHVLQKKSHIQYDYSTCTYGMIGIHIGSLTGQITAIRQMAVFNSFLEIQSDYIPSTDDSDDAEDTQFFHTRDLLRKNIFLVKDMSTLCDSATNTQMLTYFNDRTLMILGNTAVKNTDVLNADVIDWDIGDTSDQHNNQGFLKEAKYNKDTNTSPDSMDGFVLQTYRLQLESSHPPFLQWTYKIRAARNMKKMDHDEDILVDDIYLCGTLLWSSRTTTVHPSYDSVTSHEHLRNHSYRGIKAKKKWSQFEHEYVKIDAHERISKLFPRGDKPEQHHIRLFLILLIKSFGDIGIAMSSRSYNDKYKHLGVNFYTWTNDKHIWPLYDKICEGRLMMSSNEKLNQGIKLPFSFFSTSLVLSMIKTLHIEDSIDGISPLERIEIVKKYFLYVTKKIDFLQFKTMVKSILVDTSKYVNFKHNSLFKTNEKGWSLCDANGPCLLVHDKDNGRTMPHKEYTRLFP
tara:strand:+ start:3750 stop:5501 length:1752 start_codon:yes stop_codon:yes gene_type:complete